MSYVDVRKGVPESFFKRVRQAYLKGVSVKGDVFRFCLSERFLSKEELSENHLHVLRLKRVNAYKVLNGQKLNCYLKHPFVKQNEIRMSLISRVKKEIYIGLHIRYMAELIIPRGLNFSL